MQIIAIIRNDIKRINDLDEFNPNQIKVLNALFMVDEIFTGELKWYKLNDDRYVLLRSKSDQKESDMVEQKSDEQLDTKDMPDLESEESVAQRRNQEGQRLKMLTPNQMLSRLTISLAQKKKQEIILKTLKTKLHNYSILCTDKKNLQNNSIKI